MAAKTQHLLLNVLQAIYPSGSACGASSYFLQIQTYLYLNNVTANDCCAPHDPLCFLIPVGLPFVGSLIFETFVQALKHVPTRGWGQNVDGRIKSDKVS